MSLDVVKSKSVLIHRGLKFFKLLLIITILTSWSLTLNKISTYLFLNTPYPLTIVSILWEKPYVKIKFTTENSSKIHTQKIPYLKVHSKNHFDLIQDDIKHNLTSCFIHKDRVFLHRPFPFQKLIYSVLLSLIYPLILVYLPQFSFKKSCLCDKKSPFNP